MQATHRFSAALCTVAGRPLDIDANAEHMAASLADANARDAALVVFPINGISAHTAGDLLMPGLKGPLYRAVKRLAAASGAGLCLFSFRLHSPGGDALCVSAARDGRLWAVGFPELAMADIAPYLMEIKQHFGDDVAIAGAANFPIPGTDDIVGVITKADEAHARQLMAIGATVIAILSDTPAQAGIRMADAVTALSHQLGCPCVGVLPGANESTTDAAYGGERCAAFAGRVLAHAQPFDEQAVLLAEVPATVTPQEPPAPIAYNPRMPYAPLTPSRLAAWCRDGLEIAAQGLAARLKRVGSQTAVLGLSGGLDSAMALLIARRALAIAGLSQDRLLAYSLPAFGTGSRTRNNALRLMDALGLEQREINISGQVSAHLQAIGHDGQPDAAYENAQARERTQVLMDLCNMHAGLMVGPGDMSELALGFTTYGGDHMSMYGVNAGLPKTAIRLMLRQAALDSDNPALRAVLEDILNTPISPELLPGGSDKQQTERILGSYEVNDCILWHLLGGAAPDALVEHLSRAFPELSAEDAREAVTRFMRRFAAAQFKRSCLPDGPMVLGRSLSPRGGLRMPSDGTAAPWLSAIERSTHA